MKPFHLLLTTLLTATFAAIVPVHAADPTYNSCQTTESLPPPGGWGELDAELPYSAFRLAILPDAGRSPGNFVATIVKHSTATIELRRPGRVCALTLGLDDCPAIGEVAKAVEQLEVGIAHQHAAEPDRIVLHGTGYQIQVRGSAGQRHSLYYYGEHDNPIASFLHDARERLLTCVPDSARDFIDSPSES